MKIKETVVCSHSVFELDFILQNEFKWNDATDEFFDVDVSAKSDVWSEHLPIHLLEKWLSDAKSKGATHVKIQDNEDSFGYEFEGVRLEKTKS